MPKDLSVDDHMRKAKWHDDHPKVGNANLSKSHLESAKLKTRLPFQEFMEKSGKAGPQKVPDAPPGTGTFAFRS